MKKLAVFTILQCLLLIYLCSAQRNFRLRILHTNDMHARFKEISRNFMECHSVWAGRGNARNRNCYGGFARIATIVRKYRNQTIFGDRVPTLFMNAGDSFHGHGLRVKSYDKYKDKVVATFMNKLKPDVACLGNHEFDLGLNTLASYLKRIKFPVVGTNIDWSQERAFRGITFHKSLIFVINGRRVGIIGYLTPSTQHIAARSTGSVRFQDEIAFLKREVRNLKSRGVNIIIALGHSGYTKDKQIASAVEGLDVVVGGHSHTFLYGNSSRNRYRLDSDVSKGPYPTVITQPGTRRKVLVVQALAYTKYIGKLYVDFDNRGNVVNYFGNPVLLDSSVPQARDVLTEIRRWKI